MAGKKPTNIQTYRKKPHFNIGIVVFGVIFIYLAATLLMYLTDKHVSAYEVREGSILRDTAYTGLVIRDEVVVNADSTGYINYFAPKDSKVGAKTDVYSISSEKLDFQENAADEKRTLSSDEQSAILLQTQSYTENFKDEQFQDLYTLKENINGTLESKSNQSRQAQLEDMLKNNPSGMTVYQAASDGIISYSLDGYETIQEDNVTEDMVSKTEYVVKEMNNNMKVNAGDPIYKLIKEDTWSLVIPLNDSAAKELADTERIKVRFLKDGETEVADFKIKQTNGSKLGYLTFQKSMIRYVKERYLDIELIMEDETGLKIPKSSVVEKQFYTIPKDYLTQGGNSKATGVLIDNGKDLATFQNVDIYYCDTESDLVYVDPLAFDKDTVILKPESSESLPLKETKPLKGVYNINKGYAVFKQIEILCESEDYYIVKSGNSYSLANYDHIALDGETVKENDVVF